MNWTRIFRARNRYAPVDNSQRPPALTVEPLEDRSTPTATAAGAMDGGDAVTVRDSVWRMQVSGAAVSSDALTSLVAPTPTAPTGTTPAALISPATNSTISPVTTPTLAGFQGVGFFGGTSAGAGTMGLAGSTASPTPFLNGANIPGLTMAGMTGGLNTGTVLTTGSGTAFGTPLGAGLNTGASVLSELGADVDAVLGRDIGSLNTLLSPGFTAVPNSELTTTIPAMNRDNLAASPAFFGVAPSANLARGIVIV